MHTHFYLSRLMGPDSLGPDAALITIDAALAQFIRTAQRMLRSLPIELSEMSDSRCQGLVFRLHSYQAVTALHAADLAPWPELADACDRDDWRTLTPEQAQAIPTTADPADQPELVTLTVSPDGYYVFRLMFAGGPEMETHDLVLPENSRSSGAESDMWYQPGEGCGRYVKILPPVNPQANVPVWCLLCYNAPLNGTEA